MKAALRLVSRGKLNGSIVACNECIISPAGPSCRGYSGAHKGGNLSTSSSLSKITTHYSIVPRDNDPRWEGEGVATPPSLFCDVVTLCRH